MSCLEFLGNALNMFEFLPVAALLVVGYIIAIRIKNKKVSLRLCVIFIVLAHVLLGLYEFMLHKHINLKRQYFVDYISSEHEHLSVENDEGESIPIFILSPLKSVISDTSTRTKHGKLIHVEQLKISREGYNSLNVGIYKRKDKPHLLEVFLLDSPSPYNYGSRHLSSIHEQKIVAEINQIICKENQC
jgi:hypothetical protein